MKEIQFVCINGVKIAQISADRKKFGEMFPDAEDLLSLPCLHDKRDPGVYFVQLSNSVIAFKINGECPNSLDDDVLCLCDLNH